MKVVSYYSQNFHFSGIVSNSDTPSLIEETLSETDPSKLYIFHTR